jgi:hypothetical protein
MAEKNNRAMHVNRNIESLSVQTLLHIKAIFIAYSECV